MLPKVRPRMMLRSTNALPKPQRSQLPSAARAWSRQAFCFRASPG
jgi:hypothetical protein